MAEPIVRPPLPWPGEGDEVRSADGARLGRVVALFPDCLAPTHLVVERPGLPHGDWYVPLDAVAGCAGRWVRLNLTAAAVRHQGWGAPPAGYIDAAGEAGSAT